MRQLMLRNYAAKKKGITTGKTTAFIHYLSPQPPEGYDYRGAFNGKELFTDGDGAYFFAKAVYYPGETIYIREDFSVDHDEKGRPFYIYKADGNAGPTRQWRASSHMPINAARTFLEITETDMVRLADLSKETAKAIGATGRAPQDQARENWDNDLYKAQSHMRSENNPWVQVVHFRTIERPAGIPYEVTEDIARSANAFRTFTFRLAETGEIVASGNTKECAIALGRTAHSLGPFVDSIKAGRNKKYTVEITEPENPTKQGETP